MGIFGKNSIFDKPLGTGPGSASRLITDPIKRQAGNIKNKATEVTEAALPGVGGKAGKFLRAGEAKGEQLVGADSREIGQERADIRQRYKDVVGGESLVRKQMKQDLATRQKQARAQSAVGGQAQLAPAQQQAMGRQASSDIATARNEEYMQALNKLESQFRGAAGDIARLSGQYGSIGVGGQPAPQINTGGTFGTVICTELHRQGYMSDGILEKDAEYGRHIRATRPEVYVGYRFLADPIVRLMQKSPMFTKIVSIPALKWADNMAGKQNITGKLISQVGEFICGIVGKLLNKKSRRTI